MLKLVAIDVPVLHLFVFPNERLSEPIVVVIDVAVEVVQAIPQERIVFGTLTVENIDVVIGVTMLELWEECGQSAVSQTKSRGLNVASVILQEHVSERAVWQFVGVVASLTAEKIVDVLQQVLQKSFYERVEEPQSTDTTVEATQLLPHEHDHSRVMEPMVFTHRCASTNGF